MLIVGTEIKIVDMAIITIDNPFKRSYYSSIIETFEFLLKILVTKYS